ncbi:pyridoxal phosphate-dependent aminotransferase [Humibacillus sp. DSM 29435]|uniref:DegT/DnrJ/EryC1/StrS family aminotransferase n=1 Tax=Humibacillus sp. DSM 29435 TaxID=1869167 RepID=UPI00087288D4|nr:DegT/DnrJ/EryC1/StrS family aminotransferase [Humibacillus sp. DSM 29435]OFE14600.1 pyridoxal phosphate-dependent aminotransferase [Humibacillus sp. DSM 29435]
MTTSPIALGEPTVGASELAQVQRVFESGWLSGAGPTCARFEKAFSLISGVAHTVATTNCGSSLHLAQRVLGTEPGDEVIVADYTFPATGHSVMWSGAQPVFADVRADIWSIDVEHAASLVTDRTVGIIAVDPFGQPADYDELRQLTDRHGLWLVEDAACAAGASYKGRPTGSLADIASFSFHGRKGITAGEGGALSTDDPELAGHARKLHTYGIAPALSREGAATLPVPAFDELGYNYRMSDVQAGIMLAQLDRLPTLVARRRAVAERYRELMDDIEAISLPVELDDRVHPYQSYVITIGPELDRGAVALELRARGIGCNFGTYASHLQPLYGDQPALPVSAGLFASHLAIPMHANLTDDEVARVSAVVREVVGLPSTRA